MSNIKLQFISAGFKKILTSPETKNMVENISKKIQAKANAAIGSGSEGCSAQTWYGQYGGGRWVASVTTIDREAAKAEAENKALSKAVR